MGPLWTSTSGDPNVASQQTVDSTILAFGLDTRLGTHDGFFNACAAAKSAGYRIALDDFVFRQEYEALFPFTDIIKVDFLATPSKSA